MNKSNSSKNKSDEFFQASQKNMAEFVNNNQSNAENEIRSSAETSPSSKVGKVPKESENVPMFKGN